MKIKSVRKKKKPDRLYNCMMNMKETKNSKRSKEIVGHQGKDQAKNIRIEILIELVI